MGNEQVVTCELYHVAIQLKGIKLPMNFQCSRKSEYSSKREVNCCDLNSCPIYNSIPEIPIRSSSDIIRKCF